MTAPMFGTVSWLYAREVVRSIIRDHSEADIQPARNRFRREREDVNSHMAELLTLWKSNLPILGIQYSRSRSSFSAMARISGTEMSSRP